MFAQLTTEPFTSSDFGTTRSELLIARLSQQLLPLMRSHNLSLSFSDISEGGRCTADASLNPTNAYKVRGALASASAAKLSGQNVLVTASAGNHGAGLAYAASLLGMQAIIYVPENAPLVKIRTIESFGAKVVKVGNNFDECLAHAKQDLLVAQGQAKFVHPFDDLTVAAGQGTIGLEILAHVQQLMEQQPENVSGLESVRIFLPIGGGGLAAGVASTIKTFWPDSLPRPEIVGVIDESSPASLLATLFGRPVRAIPDTIADGTKVALVGNTFLSVSHLVDRLLLVPHDAITAAMRVHEHNTFTKLEGAGALALAGESMASQYNLFPSSKKSLNFAIVSGKNVDPENFHTAVTEDSWLNTSSHTRRAFDVVIQEKEGELLHFLRTVKDYNIASLTYKQQPRTRSGHLRAEFEVSNGAVQKVEDAISQAFPGSRTLEQGEQMLYEVGKPVAHKFRDELIKLDDQPGSFLTCIEGLSQQRDLGQVGFLFYRKPAKQGCPAQVVIGRQ